MVGIARRKEIMKKFKKEDFFIDQRGFLRFKDTGFTPVRDIHEVFAKQVQKMQFGSRVSNENQKRMNESKKLADNINNVAAGNFSITDIRNTLRKKAGMK